MTNIGILIVILLLYINWSSSLHPQYGFVHRLNNVKNIGAVLESGVNGIEIDICYGKNMYDEHDWYVSHSDLGLCNNRDAVKLEIWLFHLKCILYNTSYTEQLAMLWLDIKDPDKPLERVPDIVHETGLPPQLKILYDLTGYNENSRIGFQKIVDKLYDNEGVTFCAGKSCKGDHNTVKEIYNYYKSNGFRRGTFNTGDSLNIDESMLIYANSAEFNQVRDPYRFKMVLSWTHNKESEMEDFINPNRDYHTDGQIYGDWASEWNNDQRHTEHFHNAINKYSNEERLATSNDDPFHTYIRHKPSFIIIDIYNKTHNITLVNTTYILNTTFIGLKSVYNNKYIRIYPNGDMDVNSSALGVNETLTRYETNGGNYFVSTDKMFIVAPNVSTYDVKATDQWPPRFAKWQIIDTLSNTGNNTVIALQSIHNKYLSVDIDGNLNAAAHNITYSEMFEIENVPWSELINNSFIPTYYPTQTPGYCPTQLPTLSKEEEWVIAWFITSITFICLLGVSLIIISYLGYRFYKKRIKNNNHKKNNKDGKGEYTSTKNTDIEVAGTANTDV